jgi:hypothetical protein
VSDLGSCKEASAGPDIQSHRAPPRTADEMRLGLRRAVHRAQYARALRHMPEVGGNSEHGDRRGRNLSAKRGRPPGPRMPAAGAAVPDSPRAGCGRIAMRAAGPSPAAGLRRAAPGEPGAGWSCRTDLSGTRSASRLTISPKRSAAYDDVGPGRSLAVKRGRPNCRRECRCGWRCGARLTANQMSARPHRYARTAR